MSKILRRENPSEKEIVEKYKLLETFDDNLWPLNGEENPEVTQVKWDRWNQDSTAIHKRRRLNCDSAGGILLHRQDSKDLKIRPLVATTTTMQNSLAFSCHQKYGFSSATAHMSFMDKENQEARPMKFLKEKQRTFSGTDGTYQQGKLSDRNTKSCDDLETQGNLLSYWPVKTNKNNVVAKIPNFAAGLPKLIRTKDQPSDLESLEPKGLSNAKDAIAPFRATECYAEAPGAIPEALAEHRLPCIKSGRRPYLNSREENSATKPYVFLSSSPPPIQAPCEGDEIARSDAHPRLHTKYNFDQSNSTSKIHDNDVRPAATCHSISMTSVEAASNVPKKTLGIRRSMTGWPSQANQGFSIPNKAKKRY